MLAFERNPRDPAALNTYGTSLWWTAMIMTTMGSQYWPQTPEGRILCVLLALYAFAVFGYVTATLASFFIGRDAEDERGELAGQRSINELHAEIAYYRASNSRADARTSSTRTSATKDAWWPHSTAVQSDPHSGQFNRQEIAGRCRARVMGPAVIRFPHQ